MKNTRMGPYGYLRHEEECKRKRKRVLKKKKKETKKKLRTPGRYVVQRHQYTIGILIRSQVNEEKKFLNKKRMSFKKYDRLLHIVTHLSLIVIKIVTSCDDNLSG